MNTEFNPIDYFGDLPLKDLYEILEENTKEIGNLKNQLRQTELIRDSLKAIIDQKENEFFNDLHAKKPLLVAPDMKGFQEMEMVFIQDYWGNPDQSIRQIAERYNVTFTAVSIAIDKALKSRKVS